jgi:hypothetical protein
MSTSASVKPAIPDGATLVRVLQEGYGGSGWHGPDLKASLAGVSDKSAFERPAAGRHNIAENVLHHAYCVRSAHGQLSGVQPEPFVVEGEDWFALEASGPLKWPEIVAALEKEQQKLTSVVDDLASGLVKSPLPEPERMTVTLGITCHAIYHAGQIQLIKKFLGD